MIKKYNLHIYLLNNKYEKLSLIEIDSDKEKQDRILLCIKKQYICNKFCTNHYFTDTDGNVLYAQSSPPYRLSHFFYWTNCPSNRGIEKELKKII